MIPKRNSVIQKTTKVFAYPSYTYHVDFENDRILGHCDELEAVAQMVRLCLTTEAYTYPIYPNGFGIQTRDLFGKPTTYVQIKIQARVEAALMGDDRVTEITNFRTAAKGDAVRVWFTLHTIYGDAEIDEIIEIAEA